MVCECADKGCPVHIHHECSALGVEILYRVDMLDRTGTLMCEPCASDAFESGLFTDEAPYLNRQRMHQGSPIVGALDKSLSKEALDLIRQWLDKGLLDGVAAEDARALIRKAEGA